jgi:hypothetical protein
MAQVNSQTGRLTRPNNYLLIQEDRKIDSKGISYACNEVKRNAFSFMNNWSSFHRLLVRPIFGLYNLEFHNRFRPFFFHFTEGMKDLLYRIGHGVFVLRDKGRVKTLYGHQDCLD